MLGTLFGSADVLGFSLVMKGRTIRTLRRRLGWTQSELAVRLGTDPVTVSRWERGVSLPRPSAQFRLRELRSFSSTETPALVRQVGEPAARRLLERALLLERPPRRHGFSADPTRRLKEVERAVREQMKLKRRARFAS
jgi:transcriptional regulator with XRE-family HTH domain